MGATVIWQAFKSAAYGDPTFGLRVYWEASPVQCRLANDYRMKFAVEKDSSIPIHFQIRERIKTALTFGELRPGDTLPSIRELEQQTGIGRAIIRRAYLELQAAGILDIKHGCRVRINPYLQLQASNGLTERVEKLADKTLAEVRKLDVSGSSFAKLLLLRALESERSRLSYLFVDASKSLADIIAGEITKIWDVTIHAAPLDDLPDLLRSEQNQIHRVLVSYYRHDMVSKVVQGVPKCKHVEVIPISVHFTQEMTMQIERLPRKSKILLVAEDWEFGRHGRQAFSDAYTEAFAGTGSEFIVRPVGGIRNFAELAKSEQYSLIIVANSVWDRLPANVKRLKIMSHPRFEVDRVSLETARISAGVII